MLMRSIITGMITTVFLVALLVISRLLTSPQVEAVELSAVDVVELPTPPPPPDLSEPDKPDDLPPPPAPKLEFSLSESFDAPEIPLSLSIVDLRTPIEAFQTDIAPASLPIVRKAKPRPTKKVTKPTKRTPKPTSKKPKPRPKPTVKKEYYSSGELDSLPRQIRTGKFKWPSKARGSKGDVRLSLEINQSGRVRVIKVISSTDPALTSAARKVARGSKFTAPRKGGQKVKARFYKTYTLRKP